MRARRMVVCVRLHAHQGETQESLVSVVLTRDNNRAVRRPTVDPTEDDFFVALVDGVS